MQNAENSQSPSVKHPLLLLGTVVLTSVITAIDATIANVALPHMQGSLSATQDQIAWVLTSYVVASAIFIPPTAFIAARIGQQRMLGICVAGFLLTSMMCGAATSLSQMVLFRILQGAFGAGMSPLGQSIVMGTFPREQHGKVLALWGVGSMAGPVCGPSLGGWLTEVLNWRWVFYVNVPLCLIALLGVWLAIPETPRRRHETLDVFGFGMLSVAIGAFQLMLDRGQSLSWFSSTEIIVESSVAALALYLFLVHSFTAPKPFLEPRLFKDRNLILALIVVTLSNLAMMGQMALLPSYLQNLMHIPVDRTGLLMMPRGIASVFGMLAVGRLIGRVQARWLMIAGFTLMAISMYEMSTINLYVSTSTIIRIGLVQGIGVALTMVPMTTLAFATLDPALRTEGASIYSLMRNLGGSAGISLLFAHIAASTQIQHQQIGEHITEIMPQGFLPSLWDIHSTAGRMLLDAEITRQATSIGYLESYLIIGLCMAVAVPICFLFREPAHKADDELAALVSDH